MNRFWFRMYLDTTFQHYIYRQFTTNIADIRTDNQTAFNNCKDSMSHSMIQYTSGYKPLETRGPPLTMFPLSCAGVRMHTVRDTIAHKKLGAHINVPSKKDFAQNFQTHHSKFR